MEKTKYNISTDINENIKYFNEVLNADKSFDIIYRVIEIAGRTSWHLYKILDKSKSSM